MTSGSGGAERRHDYSSLADLVRETLGLLKARDSDVALNAERLKTVVDTTQEIKEQLTLMNGRVRENEKDLVAIKANPPLTRDYCDQQRVVSDGRIRTLEQRTPAIIQTVAVALTTGGVMAAVGYLLSKLP